MKVLFDASVLGAAANPHQRGTLGIFRVIEHYARALAAAPDIEPWFHARQNRAAARRYFRNQLAPIARANPARFAQPSLRSRAMAELVTEAERFFSEHYIDRPWRWLASGRICWAGTRFLLGGVEAAAVDGLNVYHSPGGILPGWTRRARKLSRFLTVYDLIPIVRPEFFPGSARRQMRASLGSLAAGDWVLCISESTRRDLLEHYPACDPARVLVTPLAAESFFYPETDTAKIQDVRRRYQIPDDTPYFLSVSTLEPRKNFESIIRAYAAFVRDDPARPSRLVLVGGSVRHDIHSIFQALAAEGEALSQRVIFSGFVPDDDLAALYSGAMAFLYLSFYEGFGLPVLEAMQCGVPVIASDNSSLPEVVGDGGTLVACTDLDQVCANMLALYGDEKLRRQQSERALIRSREFSWERFETQQLAAYRQAAKDST